MADVKRDQVIHELQRLEATQGYVGSRVFQKLTGITKYQWKVATGCHRWAQVRELAGLSPGKKQGRLDLQPTLHFFCQWMIKENRLPARDEIEVLSKSHDEVPSVTTLERRFSDSDGWKSGFAKALRSFAKGKSEFSSVVSILDEYLVTVRQPPQSVPHFTSGIHEDRCTLSDSFLPPVVACLPGLASGEETIIRELEQRRLDPDREFERRVGIAFELLGASVNPMGRVGRNEPDGLARWLNPRWALIYDAKRWERGFRLGTSEERKFLDYISVYGPLLHDEGFQNICFVVVAGMFADKDVEVAHEIARKARTSVKHVVLMEVQFLLQLIDKRTRGELQPADIERQFDRTRIATVSV